jgi:hypothetical protein
LNQVLSLNQLRLPQVSSIIVFREKKNRHALTHKIGAKCGSIYIDEAFKRWLKKLIGDENYKELDPRNASQKISSHATEGKEMRALMKAFDSCKRKFSRDHRDMKMDLPEPLDDLSIGNQVVGGELTITN